MNSNIVNIKGMPHGIIFYFNTEEAGFGQICSTLEEKLLQSGDFFINAEYIIDQPNNFSPEQLLIIEEILKKYHIRKGRNSPHLVSSDESTEMIYQTVQGNSLLFTKGIRSGQKISVRGNAIIMGDINPGGEVVATGNIIVMGCCRGVLHAGAEGNENSYILVYYMKAQQLRIAEHVATVPKNAAETPLKLAIINDGSIVLTDYQSSQFKENLDIEEA